MAGPGNDVTGKTKQGRRKHKLLKRVREPKKINSRRSGEKKGEKKKRELGPKASCVWVKWKTLKNYTLFNYTGVSF